MSGRGRGRGAYFRAKYGGGGRGSSQQRGGHAGGQQDYAPSSSTGPRDWTRLHSDLASIDGQQYGAYKRLTGKYDHTASPTFTLSIDHVQGDAYASPSKVRAIVPLQQTGFPDAYLQSDSRRIALCDFVTRVCASLIREKHLDRNIGQSNGGWSGPKGGSFNINAPGQEILPRTSCIIAGNSIEMRFTTSLPAAGRTVLGQDAHQILAVNLVTLVRQSLLHANLDQAKLQTHITSMQNQSALRTQASEAGLVGFVANGAVLPRASGASAAPMNANEAVGFRSPSELEVSFQLPDGSTVSGMGIPRGVVLLTGGGFHGKSTLLQALELGIYNHIPSDGRELVVTDPTAVKIRAEDGRSVTCTDISPFISTLPGGRKTTRFSADDASGSTSMAANIQEALEVGSKALLIDEDSSATNLLVRDQRMQSLIRQEPITPLVAKARALYAQHGVSTVIVIGGLGDWLSVADHVISMESYVPRSITAEARAVVEKHPSHITASAEYGTLPKRSVQVNLSGMRTPYASRKRFVALRPQARNAVDDPSEAEAGIDLNALDQIVEIGQSQTIATLLQKIAEQTASKPILLDNLLQTLDDAIGVDKCLPASLSGGDLVGIRRLELGAAISRMRDVIIT